MHLFHFEYGSYLHSILTKRELMLSLKGNDQSGPVMPWLDPQFATIPYQVPLKVLVTLFPTHHSANTSWKVADDCSYIFPCYFLSAGEPTGFQAPDIILAQSVLSIWGVSQSRKELFSLPVPAFLCCCLLS